MSSPRAEQTQPTYVSRLKSSSAGVGMPAAREHMAAATGPSLLVWGGFRAMLRSGAQVRRRLLG